MAVLFVARYNGRYSYFDNKEMKQRMQTIPANHADLEDEYPESFKAKRAANKLFPYYPELSQQSPAINYIYFDTFYQSNFDPKEAMPDYASKGKGFGWIAIVDEENYRRIMEDVLEYPHGELCQMYDIDIIPLNDDYNSSDIEDSLKAAYENMTPSHWH